MTLEISEFLKIVFQTAQLIFSYFWQLIKVWWWIPLPFLLWKPFLYFWLWWRNEIWIATSYKPILLEIKIPKEILKPIRAMENVITALHGIIYQPPDWWEKWIDGQFQTSLSFDIVSIGGQIHFYIRVHSPYRQAVEAAIYSQYPKAEIQEVDDYIRNVPPDIPNKEWNLWATDYLLARPNPYPIKTYPKFEAEQEKEPERIVDPIANLLEGLSKIKPDEQFWIQIRATPLAQPGQNPAYAHFLKEGEEIRDKIAKRPAKVKPKPMIKEAAEILIPTPPEVAQILISGKPAEKSTQKPKGELLVAPELTMTPGEKEIVTAIENKLSKPVFACGIRFIYLGKRESFFTPNIRLIFNFFQCYNTANMNALYPWGNALTKIKKSWFLPLNLIRDRRDYLRRRILFRQYCNRVNYLFPRIGGDKGIFILNTEELASLFHFPSWRVAPAPGLARLEEKKEAPPPGLPVE